MLGLRRWRGESPWDVTVRRQFTQAAFGLEGGKATSSLLSIYACVTDRSEVASRVTPSAHSIAY